MLQDSTRYNKCVIQSGLGGICLSTSAVLSIFKTEMGKREFQAAYADCLDLWDIPYEIKVINTSFGDTHIIVSGGEDALHL